MAKFHGAIGYGETVEKRPGVYVDEITERMYSGDLLQSNRGVQSSENLNDNINVTNRISIVADPFAYKNFRLMKYVEFMGAKWKITNVEVSRPRLILSVGGVYNG